MAAVITLVAVQAPPSPSRAPPAPKRRTAHPGVRQTETWMVVRLYRRDILQDRVLVYLSVFALTMTVGPFAPPRRGLRQPLPAAGNGGSGVCDQLGDVEPLRHLRHLVQRQQKLLQPQHRAIFHSTAAPPPRGSGPGGGSSRHPPQAPGACLKMPFNSQLSPYSNSHVQGVGPRPPPSAAPPERRLTATPGQLPGCERAWWLDDAAPHQQHRRHYEPDGAEVQCRGPEASAMLRGRRQDAADLL